MVGKSVNSAAGKSTSNLKYFGELSTSISALTIYLHQTDLSGSIRNLQTQFKSEDGKLKLVVKRKDDGEQLIKVKIKEESK